MTEHTTVEQTLQYSLAYVADVIMESARPLHALPDVKIWRLPVTRYYVCGTLPCSATPHIGLAQRLPTAFRYDVIHVVESSLLRNNDITDNQW